MSALIDELAAKARIWFVQLLRFDTSNPPGNERALIEYLAHILSVEGIPCQLVARDAARPNLVAEVKGSDPSRAPLLLSSHVDVVPVVGAALWRHPPFAGVESEGAIWGRGALDVKYKTCFDVAALIAARRMGVARTLKLVALVDEEEGGANGSAYLTKSHRELIDAEYVINEVGGFNVQIGGRQFVPLQAGEKSSATLQVVVKGVSGHGSLPHPRNSILWLSQLVASLTQDFDGFCVSATSRHFFTELAQACASPERELLSTLLDKERFRQTLRSLPDQNLAVQLGAMLAHTITPTSLKAGTSRNVIPEEASAAFDCRIVPDLSCEQFSDKIGKFLCRRADELGAKVEYELKTLSTGYEIPQGDALLQQISTCIERFWAEALEKPKVLSMLMPAASDNSFYFAAGIKPIGFAPLLFPDGFEGFALAHNRDERLPLAAFEAGARCYLETIADLM